MKTPTRNQRICMELDSLCNALDMTIDERVYPTLANVCRKGNTLNWKYYLCEDAEDE